jgi:hypothetical protein
MRWYSLTKKLIKNFESCKSDVKSDLERMLNYDLLRVFLPAWIDDRARMNFWQVDLFVV